MLFEIEACYLFFDRFFGYIRAGRLTDGPYTSYDLNTLLQATAGERRAVLLGQGICSSSLDRKKLKHIAGKFSAGANLTEWDLLQI